MRNVVIYTGHLMFVCSLFIDLVSNSDYRPRALVNSGMAVEGRGLTWSAVLSSQMPEGTANHDKTQLRMLVSDQKEPVYLASGIWLESNL